MVRSGGLGDTVGGELAGFADEFHVGWGEPKESEITPSF